MHETVDIPENEQVPISQKICYGMGGLSEFFIQGLVLALITPIFVIGMKLDPAKIGYILAGTKIISTIADPVVGIISDKTRSRWGRRKPYLFTFGILAGLLLPFIWLVPDVSENMKLLYIFVTLSFYFFFHSLFSVPYNALGYEMTSNYDERTRVFAWKKYIGIAGGLAAAWYYRFTLFDFFGNEMVGAVHLAIIIGIVIIIGTVAVTRGTHEFSETHKMPKEDKIPLGKAIAATFTNKSFLMVQGAILVVILGTGIDATIGAYLHVHYTCQGDKVFASEIGGVGGTVAMFPIFIALPTAVWISTHWGKREASIFGMVIMLIGACLIPWFLSPTSPWLVIIIWVFFQFGGQCSNLMYDSMMADVCDEDELITGERREGTYAAAASVLNKATQVLVLLIAGLMPGWAGYTDTQVDPNMEQLETMKFLLYTTDIIGVIIAISFLFFYPLTRKRCAEIRAILKEREKANDTESSEAN